MVVVGAAVVVVGVVVGVAVVVVGVVEGPVGVPSVIVLVVVLPRESVRMKSIVA